MSTDSILANSSRNFINGTHSCVSRVTRFLHNIDKKKHLNVFLSVYDQEALVRAQHIDGKILTGTAGKLAGLVVGLKDVLCYKDHPLQASSKILDGFVSQFNATAVQRLLDADAIIIGRQNVMMFKWVSPTKTQPFWPGTE
ncbi:MAG: amidase family protein [Cytophagales bacterium]|nr:amidase family protein [Cytophagales bacterium]